MIQPSANPSRASVEVIVAALREGIQTCGACGQPWTGEKFGQENNGWDHPVCYPHGGYDPNSAADILDALLARAERSEAVLRVEVEAHAKTGLLLWIMTAKRDEARRLLRAALPTFERELAEADSAGERMFLAQMIEAIEREIGEVA